MISIPRQVTCIQGISPVNCSHKEDRYRWMMFTYESGCAPKERYCYRSVVLQLKLPRLDMSDYGRKPAVGEAYERFESAAPLTPVENPNVH